VALIGIDRHPSKASWLLVGGVAVYVAVLSAAMERVSYDKWGALVIAPVLVLVSLPIIAKVAQGEPDRYIVQLLYIALIAKLVASFARWWMAFVLYGGNSDAARYHTVGSQIAEPLRQGHWSQVDLGASLMGTGFLVLVTGIIYAITGPTLLGGFLVYSWLSFWGLVFFYLAFRVALPDFDRRRYAILLLLMPSLLFWPSGIGKDGWMLFTLGLMSFGVASVLARRRGALVPLLLGAAGTAMVRPHVTVMVMASLFLAYLLARRRHQSPLGPLKTLVGIGVFAAAGFFALRLTTQFLGAASLDATASIGETLASTQRRTTGGGSTYAGGAVGSPLDMPNAILTVLFRPFPYEAHNIQALIASAEGTVLLLLFALSWRRLLRVPRLLRSRPYLTFCLAYALMFSYAFSSFSNFGILTRERVQVFPMVLVFLAVPLAQAKERRRRAYSQPRPVPVPVWSGAPLTNDRGDTSSKVQGGP
jgi:hypothetical protein